MDFIRATYAEAARTRKISEINRFFTFRTGKGADGVEITCCIPVEEGFDGPECVEFPETPALCVYYRGPYEGMHTAVKALEDYAKEHNIETMGACYSIYLEGPPQRGENSEDYITQVAVPIRV